ncbi:MAG: FAD-binding oxidoreductase [Solirubrobacteraceae bacterium]
MDSSSSATERAPRMRWWGWGDPQHPPMLQGSVLEELRERLGADGAPEPPVALERVQLPEPALRQNQIDELQRVLGADGLSTNHATRVAHAAGRGYMDLVHLRRGQPEGAPDGVAHVHDHEQILALLELCSKSGIAVVPFGGGTSVVGGVAPVKGEHEAVITLDLAGLSGIRAIDRESLSVTVAAGMRAATLERELAGHGLTLGHFPQSFEYVSLGGCAATRSAGQASTGYGRFEDLILGLRAATPAGTIELPALPASAAGPDLRELIVGSEGTLGVIDRLTLKVARRPRTRIYQGLLFSDFESGAQMLRDLAQEDAAPTVARLSDQAETELTLRLAGNGFKAAATQLYFAARRRNEGCLAILGFEGEQEHAHRAWRHARARAHDHGAIRLGGGAGEAWLASRFSAPYMRDELLTHGVMVETLETAGCWSDLHALKAAVGGAISDALAGIGTPAIVGCHISHLYESGASLYFTFLARMLRGREQRQWQSVKDAAGAAILANGGTITHHHAIGRDHRRWLSEEVGVTAIAALRSVKQQLDPAGIMNPGKLLDATQG